MTLAPFQAKTLPFLRVCVLLTIVSWIFLPGHALKPEHALPIGNSLLFYLIGTVALICFGAAMVLLIAAILHLLRRKLGFWWTCLLILVLAFGSGVTPVFYFWFIWKPRGGLPAEFNPA